MARRTGVYVAAAGGRPRGTSPVAVVQVLLERVRDRGTVESTDYQPATSVSWLGRSMAARITTGDSSFPLGR
jgi:hypothetical protein